MAFMDITQTARPRPPVFQPISDVIVMLMEHRQKRKNEIALKQLTDRTLRDIGIYHRPADRYDGRDEARRLNARHW